MKPVHRRDRGVIAGPPDETPSPAPAALGAAAFLFAVLATCVFWLLLPVRHHENESADYLEFYEPVAINIAAGRGVVNDDGEPALRYPPGYPVVLAGVYRAASAIGMKRGPALASVTLLCVGVSSVLLFATARVLLSGPVALVPSLAWSLYPPALWLTKQPNSEIIFTPLLLTAALLCVVILSRRRTAKWVYLLVGVAAGLAMLVRPIAIGLGLTLALVLLRAGSAHRQPNLTGPGLVLVANLLVVLPWQLWSYAQTGHLIPLSTGGVPSMRDGLTFGLSGHKAYRRGIWVPQDVGAVMESIRSRYDRLNSTDDVARVLWTEMQVRPFGVAKLMALKLTRAWYGTDSQRFERPLMVVQGITLLLILLSAVCGWRRGGTARATVMVTWAVLLYFWAMSLTGLPILRYLTPALALPFLHLPELTVWLSSLRRGVPCMGTSGR